MSYAIVGGQRAQRKRTALIQRRATLSVMGLPWWTHFRFPLWAGASVQVFGMPSYRFKFYDPNSRSAKLGAAVLADDDEAVAFAQRVMRELILRPPASSFGRVESVENALARLRRQSEPGIANDHQDVAQLIFSPDSPGNSGGGRSGPRSPGPQPTTGAQPTPLLISLNAMTTLYRRTSGRHSHRSWPRSWFSSFARTPTPGPGLVPSGAAAGGGNRPPCRGKRSRASGGPGRRLLEQHRSPSRPAWGDRGGPPS